MSKKPAVEFTHVERIVFPEVGITKGDVLQYYQRVSHLLLPHLRDRPLTLERAPDGIAAGKQIFWQKNSPSYYPKWITRFNMPTEEGKPVGYAIVNDLASLLYLVNQNTITFHTFLSRSKDLDHPDYVLFDLDPGPLAFNELMQIARQLRKILDKRKVKSFVKTSGKSGLHILTAPPKKRATYEDVRKWALPIAEELVDALPDIATTERTIAKRGRRAYIDVMQNGKGKHAVPPYVIRTTPTATVSMPLDWDDLTPSLTPQKFTLKVATKRLEKLAKDPLAALLR